MDKKYYDIKLEVMLPATITYRVLAEDVDQAVELAKKSAPTGIKHRLMGKKELKITVYEAGTTVIRLVKNLIGG